VPKKTDGYLDPNLLTARLSNDGCRKEEQVHGSFPAHFSTQGFLVAHPTQVLMRCALMLVVFISFLCFSARGPGQCFRAGESVN
jgi:hypothetical protein